ncbi:MAG: GNAT family N-acetyltransferase [Lentisphaeria bacterium]|nr:GNAT family N-acetyltransferase [Lentisphaeria bacterium]
MSDSALELLETTVLSTGENCKVYRLITPTEKVVPKRVIQYVISSLGYDNYRKYVNDQNYWRLYYRTAFSNQGAVDHLYLAEVNGEFAARVWFAYSRRSGFGNFGNVYTETEHRQKGLMSILMRHCVAGFEASDAKMLCCSTGSKIAAASYVKSGFHLIYGGETGPLCLLKKELGDHFSDVAEKYYKDNKIVKVRPGTIDDQYDCDKILDKLAAMRANRSEPPPEAGCFVTEYRIAFQESLNGNGKVLVAENSMGAAVGYSWQLNLYGRKVTHVVLHPDCRDQRELMLNFD